MMRGQLFFAVAVLLFSGFAAAAPPEPRATKDGGDFFEKKIRTILVRHCYECHSGDPAKAKNKFVLDTRDGLRKGGETGPAILPGHPDESLLIEAVRYEGLEMPPKGKLSEEEIDELVEWVRIGAPDPRFKTPNAKHKVTIKDAANWWSLRRPKKSPPPATAETRWAETDIDRFILAELEKKKLKPVADADRTTLLRRVTFDLTGLPPTPEEMSDFVGDSSPRAFEKVVDRLLASPQFGERWGRHWLDVVRYGESTGKDRNLPYRYAWRYRNYVIDAFNADKPYDRFVQEQIAGDLLAHQPAQQNELEIATGFLAIGTKSVVTKNAEQFRFDTIDDQIDATSRAFLALTVACARCHDHKFDPIPQTDYYALAGIFRSTNTFSGIVAGHKAVRDKELLPLAGAKKPQETEEQQARERQIAELDAEIAALHKAAAAARAPQKAAPNQKAFRGKKAAPPQTKVAMKSAMMENRDEVRKLEEKLEEVEAASKSSAELVMGARDGTPDNSPMLNRGELKDKGSDVPRGVLSVLMTAQGHVRPNESGRKTLAAWIASRDNPLTARVMVNRVWQHLFGQGLVATADNFGVLGEEPTHPELLDTLAVQFMDEKWSTKKLIRSIVLSRTYRLSSGHSAEAYAVDPSNKLLWRMERRRLDAEEIRDALLAVSGQLVRERPEGSPVQELPNGQIQGGKALQEVRKPTNVRSVYLPILRGVVPEALQVFDFADPSLIVGTRDVTTSPTQALYFMNNPVVMRLAEATARRVLAHEGLKPDERIDAAYRLVLNRPATGNEKSEIVRYLADYRKALEGEKGNPQLAAWASLCQTLFASGEFRYVY